MYKQISRCRGIPGKGCVMPQDQEQTAADRLLRNFKTELTKIIRDKKEKVVSRLVKKYKLEADSVQVIAYSREWVQMYDRASILLKELNAIKFTIEWENNVQDIITAALNFRNGRFADLTLQNVFLSNLTRKMTVLLDNFKEFRKFELEHLTEDDESDAKEALNEFVSTAEIIVKAKDYKGSNLDQLDHLLSDMKKSLKANFRPSYGKLTIKSRQSFIALAAPSMEGKTQAAFTLNVVKPLYFPLSNKQDIYLNFQSHYQNLNSAAVEDLSSFNANYKNSEVTAKKLGKMKNYKFWTIGLLMRMVTECPKVSATWMRNYANMREFQFPQVSINEVPKDYFKGYCIFLDEYCAETWTIFVRNLARVLGLKCVCSNTNTKIANIVGKDEASGSSGEPVRSIVITRLNSPCLPFLDKTHKLTKSIKAIKSAALRNHSSGNEASNPVCRFLNDFKDIQLKCLRPGAAVYIARTLRVLATTETVRSGNPTLGWLLDFMTRQLASDFETRKPSLSETKSAFFAKIGLLVPQSFYGAKDNSGDLVVLLEEEATSAPAAPAITVAPKPRARKRKSAEIEDAENNAEDEKSVAESEQGTIVRQGSDDSIKDRTRKKGFHYQREFLENHLYYLYNPQIAGKWMFLTFAPIKGERSLRTYIGTYENWMHEYTHFESNELLTMFACLSIPSRKTISTLLKEADESIYSRPENLFDNPNSRAMQVSGNPLEFSVAVSVADASQHSFSTKVKLPVISFDDQELLYTEMREYSFSGQDGCTFVKNLIVNLIDDYKFNYNTAAINVEFEDSSEFNLETDYLNNCRIPYLYSLNRRIDIFDKLSNPGSDFFVERFVRTGNKECIDGRFKFLLDGHIGNAVIECKNRQPEYKIDPKLLIDIIDKACAVEDAKLVLIFFPEAIDSLEKSKLLSAFCSTHSINVFRVIKTARRDFKIVPLFPELSLNPKYVCILFEMNMINKPM